MASRIEDQRAKERAQLDAMVRARPAAPEDDPALTVGDEVVLNPDAAFAGDTVPQSPEELQAFQDLPPPESQPFSKEGRDYYVDPAGKLMSVKAGADPSETHPELKPATAEQVHEHEIQRRSGSLGDKLDTFVETGAAELAAAGAGLYNQTRFIAKGYTGEDDIVHSEDVAPFAYTDAALEKREANPKTALAGGITADIAAQALVRGRGVGAATARNLLGGATAAGLDEALTGEPFRPHDVMLYGMANSLFEAVSHVQWGEAMRALGKEGKGAVDAAVEGAQREAIADAGRETNPARKAAALQQNAEAIYGEQQVALDQALSTIDERVTTAPDRMFTPGMLRRTVSDNALAQGERFAELSRTLDGAAQITEIPALQEAQKLLAEAYGGSGPQMFGALRQTQKVLEKGVGDLIADSPLTRDVLEGLDTTLKDEGLWGRAAKNHADFATPLEGATPSVKVDDVAAREALDGRLEQAARVASQTGDKSLAAAVKAARGALAEADKVTGARLLGPVQTAVLGKLTQAAKGAVSAHAGKLIGGLAGGWVGGLGGALAGTIAGDIAGHVAAPYIERAAARMERLGMQSALRRKAVPPEQKRLGTSWVQRIWNASKDVASRHPTKIIGAGLLAGSALGGDDDSPTGTAAASVGLLSFFLPSGGRARLAEELGRELSGLSARERMYVRMATERTARDVEGVLYSYARREPHVTHEAFGKTALGEAQDVENAQFTIQLREYARRAGLGEWSPARDPMDEIPDHIKDVIQADLRARNAAIIENDEDLRRLAEPGRFGVMEGGATERTPYQISVKQLDKAKAALQEGDMPQWASRMLAERQRHMEVVMGHADRDYLERQAAEQLQHLKDGAKRGMGRPLNAREAAYAEAAFRNVVEARRESTAAYQRQNVRAGTEQLEQQLEQRRARIEGAEPPDNVSEGARAGLLDARRRVNETIDAARRGDVPSHEILEQNPRKYYEQWLQDSTVRGLPFFEEGKAWAKRNLLDPVYEYLGREPTVGEGLPRIVREMAERFGADVGNPALGKRPQAAELFNRWKSDAELRLSRELTPEELAWGREQIVERRPELRALEGGGEAAPAEPGAGGDFRRAGLPEPTQPGEVPVQYKLGYPPREPPVSIEGEPAPSVVQADYLRRRQASIDAIQPGDLTPEQLEHMGDLQGRIRQNAEQGVMDLRLDSDRDLRELADRHTSRFVNAAASFDKRPPNEREIEYIRGRFEGQVRRIREEQLRARPLNADERAQRAYNRLQDRDMPERFLILMEDQTRDLRSAVVRAEATNPKALRQLITRKVEEFSDRWVEARGGRPPPARVMAYVESHYASEAARAFERDLGERARRVAEEKAARLRAEAAEREALLEKKRTAAEEKRVEELMGAFDLPEDRQHELGTWMDEAERQHGYTHEQATENGAARENVIEKIRELHPELTPGEEVFLRDQLNVPAPVARPYLQEAVDHLASLDDGSSGDSIPRLDLEDLIDAIERGETRRQSDPLDHWEEYHLRREWEENQNNLSARYEHAIEENRREREPPDSERDPDSEDYDGRSRDDAPGLPDYDDLRDMGIESVSVEDSRGVARVFGQDLSKRDLEDLLALQVVREMGAEGELTVGRGYVGFQAQRGDFHLERTYRALGDGDGFTVYHGYLFLPDEAQGQGLGKKMLRRMFPAYERLGAVEVSLSCANVGCYEWPHLGFRPSRSSEEYAIDRFFNGPFFDDLDLVLPAETRKRLEDEIDNVRDLSDARVPLADVQHRMDKLERAYGDQDNATHEELFVDGDEYKIGKLFLLTKHGSWNSGLSLSIDRSDEWYLEFLHRLGISAIGGLGLQQMYKALQESPMTVRTTPSETDSDTAAGPQGMLGPSQEEQLRIDQSREKLTYVQEQAKSATVTTARALVTPAQQARTVTVSPGLTQSAGVASFAGPHDNLRSAYEQKKATIQRIARDPMSLVDEMSEKLADVADAAPQAHVQVVAKTYQILNFLQGKIPSTIGVSLLRPDGTPPSETALRQFALYYSAATNPSTVLTDLANNRARKEQVETLRELWPEVYQRTKLDVLEALADATQKTRPSFNQRARLDLLFDFGPALDGAFSPRITQIAQNAQPDAAQKAPGSKMPSRGTQPSITGSSALSPLYKGAAGIAAA